MIRFTGLATVGLATVGYPRTFQVSLHARFGLTFAYSKRAEASISESCGVICVVDVCHFMARSLSSVFFPGS